MRCGVNRRASAGVLVNSLKPQRTSAESFESSSEGSVNGFLGKSQAVTIVVRAGISGPASGTPDDVVGRGVREQLSAQAARIIADASFTAGIIGGSLTYVFFP